MRRSLGSLAAVALLAFSIVAPAEQRGQPLPATTADVTVPPRPLNQGGRGGGTDSTITGGASRSGSGQAVVNLCSIFPSAPECGGPKQGICNDPAAQNYGQPGACIYAPPPPPPPPPAAIVAGCLIDTDEFDTVQSPHCSAYGKTAWGVLDGQVPVAFYVGDTYGPRRENLFFADPGMYLVDWSGDCTNAQAFGPDRSGCQITMSMGSPSGWKDPGSGWKSFFRRATATVRRRSDMSVVATFTIEASGEICTRNCDLPILL